MEHSLHLSFRQRYKSVSAFPPAELPSFCVVTGPNGAGKSHLLLAIDSGAIAASDENGLELRCNYQSLSGLSFASEWSPPGRPATEIATAAYDLYAKSRADFLRNASQTVSGALLARLAPSFEHAVAMSPAEVRATYPSDIADQIVSMNDGLEELFLRQLPAPPQNVGVAVDRVRRIVEGQAKIGGSSLRLRRSDFLDDPETLWGRVDLFDLSYSHFINAYRRKWQDFFTDRMSSVEATRSTRFDGSELVADFERAYGQPPWKVMNEALKIAELDFRVAEPQQDSRVEYRFRLIKNSSGMPIEMQELSSGEKILFLIATAIFKIEDKRQIMNPPTLLLLDEIDAPLHPSLLHRYLKIVRGYFVDTLGLNVICVTHSPTTIALAPEDAIYSMEDSAQGLVKVTKDAALRSLVKGLPMLNIDYSARRHVLTESVRDAAVFSALYTALVEQGRPELGTGRSLEFVGAGASTNGGCDQVLRLVGEIAESGSKQIFGVIDWDLENRGNSRVGVLASGRRYSIENVILDPIVIAAAIGRDNRGFTVPGFGLIPQYLKLRDVNDQDLQRLSDAIVSIVLPQLSGLKDADLIPVKYAGGRVVSVSKKYLQMRGHDLQSMVFERVPQMKRYITRDGDLDKVAILVLSDVPEWIPGEIVDLFEWLLSEDQI